ncbi:MAG: glycosyltransferase family 2 protein [Frankiaceae bacterium]|nr:glycosyltransferase family 2 protein [Frankiaceae bacterium]MBV9871494.1 glycosyltransferase family 2 protein [Frankiaceae bacterium]
MSAVTPMISVVIPTYERPDLLRRCLAALAAQDLAPDRFEVVVVDDGSGPEVRTVLEEASTRSPQLRWLAQATNQGPAAARNLGVAEARGDLILFMDDDIVATPSLVRDHVELHDRANDPTLGVIGRVAWHPDLQITPFMRWLDTTSHQFAYETWMREGPIAKPWEAFYTCNLSLHRALFETTGGFNETFPFAACEDTELGYRLWKNGFHLEYRPAVLGWNARPITLSVFRKRMEKAGESLVILERLQPELQTMTVGEPEGPTPARGHAEKLRTLVMERGRLDKLRGAIYQRIVTRAQAAGMDKRAAISC